jgi:FAD/FMN-containing dehydrogenase
MASNSSLQCNWLSNAGLGALLLYPSDTGYADRESSYWAANTPLHPQCIVQPRTTTDVSRIVQALSQVDGKAAVRSGGHMQWAGSNDIQDGITIDLGLMTDVTYDPATSVASIQPGPRWGDVYSTLDAQGVCVTGGRDANVGIAGFLTGGGNSYYTGKTGMACDNVVNFEVVLGSGEVVNANENEHPDLWKALKGGSGNFGIVTRFDMQAFPAAKIWGGMRASERSAGDQITKSLVNFVDSSEKNPEDAYIINFTYNPSMFSDVVIASVIVDTDGVANATAFNEIQQIPTLIQDVKTRSMSDIAETYVLPSGQRYVPFVVDVTYVCANCEKSSLVYSDCQERCRYRQLYRRPP